MGHREKVIEGSESIISLLTAQCADLEELLALAREETAAAEQGNFLSILDIVTERERIGNRLEECQRQTERFRAAIDKDVGMPAELADRIVETARLTIEQDMRTRMLLDSAKEDLRAELDVVERRRHSMGGYRQPEEKGTVCDQRL